MAASPSPIIAIQTALVQRLANDADLLAVLPIDLMADQEKDRRLYDYFPEEVESSYIHIAEPRVSKVYVAPQKVVDVSVTIHMWHNQALTGEYGNYKIATILQAVKNALRYKLTMPTHDVMYVTITDERIMEDIDADVKHAVFSLTYKLEEI